MMRPIAISLSPNTEKDDVILSFKLLLSPWNNLTNGSIKLLEEWFRKNFKSSFAVSFNSGRSSLYGILKAMGIGKGDEVILQAFTCVAVPNAILWAGATPVYADVQTNLTLDPADVQKKITKKTKAILVQHTFGIPSQMDKLREVAEKHSLFVIEDCAHTIGGTYKNKKLGQFGDASFFSFGRDKAFSSVFGGMAITNNQEIGRKIRAYQKEQEMPSLSWTMQQLFHPVAFSFILSFYNFFSVGKVFLFLLQKLHLLSFPVSPLEKETKRSGMNVRKMPNSLAGLALRQVGKLERYNKKRVELSEYYLRELKDISVEVSHTNAIPFLRFPVFSEKKEEILKYFKKKKVYIGNWYSFVIDPQGVGLKNAGYEVGSCPNAEEYSRSVINLPTYPTMTLKDARKVVGLLKQCTK